MMKEIKAFDILKNTLYNTLHEDWRVPKKQYGFNARYRTDLDETTTIEAIPRLFFFVTCDIYKWDKNDKHDHVILSETKFNPLLARKMRKNIKSKRKVYAVKKVKEDYEKLLSEIPNNVLKDLGINVK